MANGGHEQDEAERLREEAHELEHEARTLEHTAHDMEDRAHDMIERAERLEAEHGGGHQQGGGHGSGHRPPAGHDGGGHDHGHGDDDGHDHGHGHGHGDDDGHGHGDGHGQEDGHGHGHHAQHVRMTVVANGTPVLIEAGPHEVLGDIRRRALELTHNVAQPPENWELKTEAGDVLDPEKRVADYRFGCEVTLFLSLAAGIAGA